MADTTRPTIASQLPEDIVEKIAEKRHQLLWAGIGLTLVGILALLFPVLTTLTVELMFGWVVVFAGLLTIYGAFSVEGTGPFFGELLLGLLKLGLGIYLLTHPGLGMLVLTLLLAAVFMVDGAVQIRWAFDMKRSESWVWMLLSGIVSIIAGLLIASGLPETKLFVLGLLVGVNFLSTGIAFIMLSQTVKRAGTATAGKLRAA